jgi:hypothetical protein
LDLTVRDVVLVGADDGWEVGSRPYPSWLVVAPGSVKTAVV